jgi:hypothetical protein
MAANTIRGSQSAKSTPSVLTTNKTFTPGVSYRSHLRTKPHQDSPTIPLISKTPGHASMRKMISTVTNITAAVSNFNDEIIQSMLETVKGLESVCNWFLNQRRTATLDYYLWNANGVQSKKHELQELLRRERIYVCAINETHSFLTSHLTCATLLSIAKTGSMHAAGAWLSW